MTPTSTHSTAPGPRAPVVGLGPLVVALSLLSVGPGCAQNAAFELQLDLPPGPVGGPPVFVLVQPRKAADNPFEDEWRGDDLAAIELTEAETHLDHVSVMSTDGETDVHLKVRFCASENCTAIEDDTAPEIWISLTHPFYIGERTSWEKTIATIPTERDTSPEIVDRCDIKGCVDGPLSSYCRADGRHLCE